MLAWQPNINYGFPLFIHCTVLKGDHYWINSHEILLLLAQMYRRICWYWSQKPMTIIFFQSINSNLRPLIGQTRVQQENQPSDKWYLTYSTEKSFVTFDPAALWKTLHFNHFEFKGTFCSAYFYQIHHIFILQQL